MISWIQRSFQHHFRTIFGVLLAITIISFIFTIGSTPGLSGSDRQYVKRSFFGHELNSASDMNRAQADAELSVQLQVGFMALDADAVQKYTLQRLTSLHLADEYHIPVPTTAELTSLIKTLRAFAGPTGEFDATRYATLRDSLRTSTGTSEADVARVLGDDWRAAKVQDLLGGPGYVLPGDVRNQLIEADTTWTLAVATADYAAYGPEIKPSDAELSKFYTDNTFRYEIAPRVVASYIDFPSSNYLSEVKVTDDEVKAYYDANPAQFPKPAAAAPAPAAIPALTTPAATDPAADFAAVKPQVEAALKIERAKRLAAQAASDTAFKLYDSKITADTLPAYLAANKMSVKQLAPFTKADGPAELGKSPEIADAAFALNANRVFSDAVATPNGAAVLIWKETQTVRTPPYAEVKDKVAADYAENEKRKRFIDAGKATKTAVETRLKAGDSFDQAVAASAPAGIKFETKTVAPFTLRTPPADIPTGVVSAIAESAKGQVSDMAVVGDKGYLVYVADKKLPDVSDTSEAFATARTQVANAISRYNSQSYVQEIMDQELKRSEPVVP